VYFDFSTTFAWNISHPQTNCVRNDHNILVFTWITRYFQILMKLEFSQQILKKYSNIKVHENPSTGNQCCSMQTDITKLTAAFRNFANTPNNMNPRSQYSQWQSMRHFAQETALQNYQHHRKWNCLNSGHERNSSFKYSWTRFLRHLNYSIIHSEVPINSPFYTCFCDLFSTTYIIAYTSDMTLPGIASYIIFQKK